MLAASKTSLSLSCLRQALRKSMTFKSLQINDLVSVIGHWLKPRIQQGFQFLESREIYSSSTILVNRQICPCVYGVTKGHVHMSDKRRTMTVEQIRGLLYPNYTPDMGKPTFLQQTAITLGPRRVVVDTYLKEIQKRGER